MSRIMCIDFLLYRNSFYYFYCTEIHFIRIVSYDITSRDSKIFAGCGRSGTKDGISYLTFFFTFLIPRLIILGDLNTCELHGPRGLYKDKDRIIVCDSDNNAIRIIQNNQITTRKIKKYANS